MICIEMIFYAQNIFWKKKDQLKRKEFAPKGANSFLLREDPFSEMR